MVTLIIVESPAKCSKIEKYLGSQYRCKASFGHIRDIRDGLKGIDVKNNFAPTFRLLSNKMRYIDALRREIGRCSEVVLATDDDREGEAIAWHICQAFHLPVETTKRIIFHEITKPALQKAIKNPQLVDMKKVHSQQARQILDLLVGFRITPILWRNISMKTGLSAGRCQTPALRLVYENQKNIDESPGKQVYDTTFYMQCLPDVGFILNYKYKNRKGMEKFLKESVDFKHKYKYKDMGKQTSKPPSPLTTSLLQQKASSELHFSPKMTMRLAQKLYEGGYITYMRTDSKTYSAVFIDTAKEFITQRYGDAYINASIKKLSLRKTKGLAQEAHEAIRPTSISRSNYPTDPREKKLYMFIWRTTIESCMASAIYFSLQGLITAPQKKKYTYRCQLIDFPGWKMVGGYDKDNPVYHSLLKLEGEVSYTKIYSKYSLKELKMHYTEARLIHLLEKKGIGRPSTFSSLITKIQDRGYVQKENVKGKKLECIDYSLVSTTLTDIKTERIFGNERNKLVLQAKGMFVMEFLLKHFETLFQYDYTKTMEEELDSIAKGEKVWYELCDKCNNEISLLANKVGTGSRESIRIDDNHIYTIGRYGPVIRCEIDGETTFKPVKKNIDMKKLKGGEYTLEELVEKTLNKSLGVYQGMDVILKKGKYGLYVRWKEKNYSVKNIDGEITLDNVIPFLSGERSANPNIIRILNDHLSIRKSKWGVYIYFKTETMKKPKFLKFNVNSMYHIKTCDKEILLRWIKNKYEVE